MERALLPREWTWDLESVYLTIEDWQADFRRVEAMLPELAACRGRLAESGATLLACLQLRDQCGVYSETDGGAVLGKLWTYARHRRDEDQTNEAYQALWDRVTGLVARAREAQAFIEPELLALSSERLAQLQAEEPGLALYGYYLERLQQQRTRVRSAEVEAVLARAAELAGGPEGIYMALSRKLDSQEHDGGRLTRGRYLATMEHPDRQKRRHLYRAFWAARSGYVGTLAAVLESKVKYDVFAARARGYGSALEERMAANGMPVSVYHSLIGAVRGRLGLLHRYLDVKRQLLGFDHLHAWDVAAPVVRPEARNFSWDEACHLAVAALAPLGAGVQAILRQGLADRWVDVCETPGKRAGAYSWGAPGNKPFILMNFRGDLDSVRTLIHELGHSLNSCLSWRTQPQIYAYWPIAIGEVPPLVNEVLLNRHLQGLSEDPAWRQGLLVERLEGFRTTLFRQTMLAEFELAVHERVEQGGALTPSYLCELCEGLTRAYQGPAVEPGDGDGLDWTRVMSLFQDWSTYYVYQYGMGQTAASALAGAFAREGAPAVERYLAYLSAGSSAPPVELLRRAGVDIATPAYVEAALDEFDSLIESLMRL